jgi:hypothetical protein
MRGGHSGGFSWSPLLHEALKPAHAGGGVLGHGVVQDKNAAWTWNRMWRVVTEPPRHGHMRARALARTRGHGTSSAAGMRALAI